MTEAVLRIFDDPPVGSWNGSHIVYKYTFLTLKFMCVSIPTQL